MGRPVYPRFDRCHRCREHVEREARVVHASRAVLDEQAVVPVRLGEGALQHVELARGAARVGVEVVEAGGAATGAERADGAAGGVRITDRRREGEHEARRTTGDEHRAGVRGDLHDPHASLVVQAAQGRLADRAERSGKVGDGAVELALQRQAVDGISRPAVAARADGRVGAPGMVGLGADQPGGEVPHVASDTGILNAHVGGWPVGADEEGVAASDHIPLVSVVRTAYRGDRGGRPGVAVVGVDAVELVATGAAAGVVAHEANRTRTRPGDHEAAREHRCVALDAERARVRVVAGLASHWPHLVGGDAQALEVGDAGVSQR